MLHFGGCVYACSIWNAVFTSSERQNLFLSLSLTEESTQKRQLYISIFIQQYGNFKHGIFAFGARKTNETKVTMMKCSYLFQYKMNLFTIIRFLITSLCLGDGYSKSLSLFPCLNCSLLFSSTTLSSSLILLLVCSPLIQTIHFN